MQEHHLIEMSASVTLITVALAIVFICTIPSGGTLLQGCPDTLPHVQSSFDVNQYTGVWYEIARFKDTPFEKDGVCVTANYTIDTEKPGRIVVVNSERVGTPEGKVRSVTGYAYTPEASVPAKLKVKFERSPVEGDYQVLMTDYDNSALVYSCQELAGVKMVDYAWILARKPTLDQETIDQLKDKLRVDLDVDVSRFMETRQDGCW